MKFIGSVALSVVCAWFLYAGVMFVNVYYEYEMHTLHKETIQEKTCIYGNDK